MKSAPKYAIGIDFGTTKSLLSYISRSTQDSGAPQFASFNVDGHMSPTPNDTPYYRPDRGINVEPVPTVIAIDRTSEDMTTPNLIPGFKALDRGQLNYPNFFLVRDLKSRLSSLKIKERKVAINEQQSYDIEGLVAHFLASLRKHATQLDNIALDPLGVTITIPARSGLVQRMSTQMAAKIAGFEGTIELLEEPVAAFLFHYHQWPQRFSASGNQEQRALVFDFGGGTCDLAVIEYQHNKLPRVIGRAMARFGGEGIDELFLKKFWLQEYKSQAKPEAQWPLMSVETFETMDLVDQALLLAYARKAKEQLSESGESYYIQPIDGLNKYVSADPSSTGWGDRPAPTVYKADLMRMLEETPLPVYHSGEPAKRQLSIKQHVELLLKRVLTDAGTSRRSIKKLIFAGGSVQLPSVKEWVTEFFTQDIPGVEGKPHPPFDPNDIHTNYPEVCVAGGATIHQLYRHHQKRQWRQVIQPTLPSDYHLVHHRDSRGQDEKIVLGQRNRDTLPIQCTGLWRSKVILNPKPWADDGKYKFEIWNTEWKYVYQMEGTLLFKRFWDRILPAVFVEYHIDEFGILQSFKLTPGSLFAGIRRKATEWVYAPINQEQAQDVDFHTLQLTNRGHIEKLRRLFIPEILRLKI